MGDISGSNDIGGIVGVLKSGSIDTCFNAGSITSTGYLVTADNMGGIVGDMGITNRLLTIPSETVTIRVQPLLYHC